MTNGRARQTNPIDKSTNVRPKGGRKTAGADSPAAAALGVAFWRGALAVSARVSPALAARWAERLFFTPPPARKSRTALPPGAERLDIEGVTGRIAVWSWGSGPSVYLVHGWGGRAEQLGAFVAPLLARGFRVIALDGPGHGASEGRRSSGPEMGRALAAVVGHLGPARGVVAHSLGAAAVAFAMREGLSIERLAFVGPPANPLTWVDVFARRLGLGPAVLSELRRRSEARIAARWEDLPLVPLRGLPDPPPLLVVHDRDDREVSWDDGVSVAAAWPGARLMETSGLGHRRVLRDPAVVAAVSAFLAGDEDACAHGRPRRPSACESCALEAELFVPALRRGPGVAAPAHR
jgi:pimeloyl-ACP methyl ester carboxylesterase